MDRAFLHEQTANGNAVAKCSTINGNYVSQHNEKGEYICFPFIYPTPFRWLLQVTWRRWIIAQETH